jgi:hypothetical protein
MVILTPKYPQVALRKNHKKSLPVHCLYLDTETKKQVIEGDEAHRMNIAWTCYTHRKSPNQKASESWNFWDSTFQLCDYIHRLTAHKRALFLFGHNIFFDLQVSDFFYYFTRWGWELDFIYDASLTFILIIHKEDRAIKALSTTNYFETSLEEMGKMVSLPKLGIDFDACSREELKTYCRRDVEIIKKSMEQYFGFITTNDMGRFSLSKASQAMNAYRHRFMNKKIYIHKDPKVIELERQAYMGGRVECFRIGKQDEGPFITLDINSLFPYIMKSCPLPSKLIDYEERVDLNRLYEALKNVLVIAEVDLQTEDPIYAVREGQKIIFPVGTFRAFLCTPCLTEAFQRGHVIKVLRAAYYKPDYLFTEYVDYFYELRKRYKFEGNTIFEYLTKKLLNSLYGKFAQGQPKTKKILDLTCHGYWREEGVDLVNGDRVIRYKLFNVIVEECGRESGKNTLVAIPAHITEWARYILYSIIEKVGRDRVLYCDTDSIKIRKKDLSLVKYPIDPQRLGALKVENESQNLLLLGAKSYVTESERHIKGVPSSAKQVGESLYEYFSFPKLDTHMKKRILRYHIVEKVLKEAAQFYDKGVIENDGSISPIRFFL